jgi:soluble P-type ATPase
MTVALDIPGRGRLELEFLLLDVNGTLSDRGELIAGVAERLSELRKHLEPRLLSADTFGSLGMTAEQLALPAQTAASAEEKLAALQALGPHRCVAIGNGSNDQQMLAGAALGIAIVGPEGCSAAALAASDIVCSSIADALNLLAEPRTLAATLRA